MSLFLLLMAGNNNDLATLTLSGETINSTQSNPTNAVARLKVDNDGRVYKSEDTGSASYLAIDSATDWVRPLTAAPGAYEVRFTTLTGDALTSSTVSEDTWHPLSSGDFELVLQELGIGSNESTFDVEIRNGSSGGAEVSAEYILQAEVNP